MKSLFKATSEVETRMHFDTSLFLNEKTPVHPQNLIQNKLNYCPFLRLLLCMDVFWSVIMLGNATSRRYVYPTSGTGHSVVYMITDDTSKQRKKQYLTFLFNKTTHQL